jgi:ATP-dependent DNA helicase RecQ
VLFYSWADVMSLERLLEGSEVQDPQVAAQQRRAVRQMFDLADHSGCMWTRLAAHFAEAIEPCGTSCGACLRREEPAVLPGAGARFAPSEKLAPARPDEGDRGRPAAPSSNPATAGTAASSAGAGADADSALFERLRVLRKRLADERGVPAFVVFTDRALQEMAARQPRSRAQLLDVYGVGQKKLEEYGDIFLAEIQRSD